MSAKHFATTASAKPCSRSCPPTSAASTRNFSSVRDSAHLLCDSTIRTKEPGRTELTLERRMNGLATVLPARSSHDGGVSSFSGYAPHVELCDEPIFDFMDYTLKRD